VVSDLKLLQEESGGGAKPKKGELKEEGSYNSKTTGRTCGHQKTLGTEAHQKQRLEISDELDFKQTRQAKILILSIARRRFQEREDTGSGVPRKGRLGNKPGRER